jgi:hypothetical protein
MEERAFTLTWNETPDRTRRGFLTLLGGISGYNGLDLCSATQKNITLTQYLVKLPARDRRKDVTFPGAETDEREPGGS